MENEKQLSEKESLQLIADMINKAKNSYVDSGIGPLFWGVLVTFCSLVTFAEIQFNFDIHFDIWLLTIIAFIPQVYFSFRGSKSRQLKTYDDEALNYVWATFAIIMFLLVHYNFRINPSNSIPLFLLTYGVPTFITGGLKRFMPMIAGGIVCWICCIISVYTKVKTGMLLTALSATCAWVLPGIILRRKYLKLKHV